MSPPWMPLYIGDYLADTAHLKAAEHGAYLLLIMHYWRTGGVPDDDAVLARIARMSAGEWKRARPAIEPLFGEGWKHKRIEFELTEAARISEAGRKGGQASGAARRAKSERPFNDRSTTVERSGERLTNDSSTIREALHSPSQSQKLEIEEEPEKTLIPNLADAVGGRKPTRPSIDAFFDQFWKAYPKRGDAANPKKPARDKFEGALKRGAEPAQIIAAAQRYCEIETTAGRSNTEKIAQAVTWLTQQRWNDYPQAAPAGTPVPPDPSMPSHEELKARYAARIPDPKPEDAGLFREGDGAHSADEEALRH